MRLGTAYRILWIGDLACSGVPFRAQGHSPAIPDCQQTAVWNGGMAGGAATARVGSTRL
jgi:hypothetical protein